MTKISDFTFIIAVRKGSQRIKNKNIKKFYKSSLLEIKLEQIKRVCKRANILFSSDCKKSIKIAKKHGCIINSRPHKYCTSRIPMKEVYRYLASLVKTKYVCYLHVTSPLLNDKSLKNSLKRFLEKEKNYDSLATVNEVREYLWYQGKSINYNSNNHPRSQTLPIYYALNFAINIIDTKTMFDKSRIVGKNFYPFVLKFPENIDVDEPWQFENAQLLYKFINKKR